MGAPRIVSRRPVDEARVEAAELSRRLPWLIFFRVGIVTVLLAIRVFINISDAGTLFTPVNQFLFALIIATYTFTLGSIFWLKSGLRLRGLAYGQIAVDLILASGLVYATEVEDSVFTFMFLLTIINAAVVLYGLGAFAAAFLSALLFTLMVYAAREQFLSILLAPWFETSRKSTGALFNIGLVNISAFFMVAALSTYLMNQLRAAGRSLAVTSADLQSLTNLHESIVSSIGTGLISVDRSGKVVFINRAGQEILGINTIPRGAALSGILPGLDLELARAGPSVLPARKPWVLEINHGSAGDNPRVLGVSCVRLTGASADDDSDGDLVVIHDLSEYRAMEAAVARAQRLADTGKLAAALAHELRNPLASMSGAIELMSENEHISATDRQLMSIALRETERLNDLVTDFLSFARPTQPAFLPIELDRFIADTLTMFAQNRNVQRHITVKTNVASPLVIEGDSAQLKQLFWNLLENAVQASPPADAVIEVRAHPADLASPGDIVRWEVIDHGKGIPAADRARIFEPFFTTKPNGTGLGLATVGRIVENHHGGIEVLETPGGGVTFVVTLPARATPGAQASSPGVPAAPAETPAAQDSTTAPGTAITT